MVGGVFGGAVVKGVIGPVVAEVAPKAAWTGVGTTVGIWSPGPATVLLIGLTLGLVFAWVATGGMKVRVVRPFIGGEVPGNEARLRGADLDVLRAVAVGPVSDVICIASHFGCSLCSRLRGRDARGVPDAL